MTMEDRKSNILSDISDFKTHPLPKATRRDKADKNLRLSGVKTGQYGGTISASTFFKEP